MARSEARTASLGELLQYGQESMAIPIMAPLVRSDTERSDVPSSNDGRPDSAMSMRHEYPSSSSLASMKWYKRFNRSSSSRLSKALETSEAASISNTGKTYNPFTRRRSVPMTAPPSQSILGQSTKRTIEIGGLASNSLRVLPPSLLPRHQFDVIYMVDTCITWLLEKNAHRTPGIFRINGSSQAVKEIITHFSSGCIRMPLENIPLPAHQLISTHDVASCLKKFLVLLPGGLFGEDIFEQLLALLDDLPTVEHTTPDLGDKIGSILWKMPDRSKFNILMVVFAFLKLIANESVILARNDDPKQDSGYMTSFSLGIVFSPACLGAREESTEMRRSSTSYSDRSIQSDTTPIEEAVAVARQGARIVRMLLDHWEIVVDSLNMASSGEDSIEQLEIVELPTSAINDYNSYLQTIVDSPVKKIGRQQESGTNHVRNESVDTVTVSKKSTRCQCETTLMLKDAQIDLLAAKIKELEAANEDAVSNLSMKSQEAAALYNRNLELERRLKALTLDETGDIG